MTSQVNKLVRPCFVILRQDFWWIQVRMNWFESLPDFLPTS